MLLLLFILNVINLRNYDCLKQNLNSSEYTAVFMRGKMRVEIQCFFPLFHSFKLEKLFESTVVSVSHQITQQSRLLYDPSPLVFNLGL